MSTRYVPLATVRDIALALDAGAIDATKCATVADNDAAGGITPEGLELGHRYVMGNEMLRGAGGVRAGLRLRPRQVGRLPACRRRPRSSRAPCGNRPQEV